MVLGEVFVDCHGLKYGQRLAVIRRGAVLLGFSWETNAKISAGKIDSEGFKNTSAKFTLIAVTGRDGSGEPFL